MKTEKIIAEICDLPVDQRIEIVDHILSMLDPSDPKIDKAWLKEARQRLNEIRERQIG